jgi:hypothetical protein
MELRPKESLTFHKPMEVISWWLEEKEVLLLRKLRRRKRRKLQQSPLLASLETKMQQELLLCKVKKKRLRRLCLKKRKKCFEFKVKIKENTLLLIYGVPSNTCWWKYLCIKVVSRKWRRTLW